jgi:hypothetical protein
MGTLTLTKADQCLWLGRYTERVFTELEEFFRAFDANVDLDTQDFSAFWDACDYEAEGDKGTEERLFDMLYDHTDPSSVCSDMRAAFGNAILLRPELGTATTSYIELALLNLRKSKEPAARLVRHRTVCDDILAFWGAVEDGDAPLEVKSLIGVGKYVERADLCCRFGRPQAALDEALGRIGIFLEGIESPECLPLGATLSSLAEAIGSRGYDCALATRLADACVGKRSGRGSRLKDVSA